MDVIFKLTTRLLLSLSLICAVDGTWKECNILGKELSCIDSFPSFPISKQITKLRVWAYDRHFTSVPPNAFENFTHVREIHLYGASFREMNPEAFRNLTHLVELDLEKNSLGPVLRNNIFIHLKSLRKLNLGWNQIKFIGIGAFTGLDELRDLELSHNRLKRVEKGTFAMLGNLRDLHMAGNEIDVLEDGVFEGLGSLHTLNLMNNQIPDNLSRNVFTGINPNLWGLILDRNKLSVFPRDIFDPISGLQVLSMSSNRLSDLPFPWPESLKNLYGFSFFNNSVFKVKEGLFSGLNLTQIYGSGNPYYCNCDLLWYIGWLQTQNLTTAGELTSYECFGPARLKKKSFSDLSEKDLSTGAKCSTTVMESRANSVNTKHGLICLALAFLYIHFCG